MRVTIIGAGLSGISQAIQLKRQLGDEVVITIIERDDDIGGIWLNSTWPGAGVDIPVHLYSLYSDSKADWPNVFASQEEMLRYLRECVASHGLDKVIKFDTAYLGSRWDSVTQTHTLRLKSAAGEYEHVTDILISASGPLSRPLLPNIPGRDLFEGHTFHNLHWRKQSIDLSGKRIAVIGNGSSAVQFIPGLANLPGVEIVQYIRSGGYYFPKVNTAYTSLQRFSFAWIPGARLYYRWKLFKGHNDRWKARNSEDAVGHDETEQTLLEYLKQEAPEEYLDALTPDYPLGCKRPAYDAGWLASLHLPNVSLNGQGIREITEDSVTDNTGAAFQADVIIYATGSEVGRHGVGLNENLYGEDGLELKAYWESIGGPQSYLGIAVPKFPNYFITIGPNAVAGSWGYTIGNQTTVIARMINEMVRYGIGSLQAKEEVFTRHNAKIQESLAGSTMNSNQCTNWWRIDKTGRNTVSNSVDAIGLWWQTRSTNWIDWVVHSKNGEQIDVQSQIQRERVLFGSVLVSAAVLAGVLNRWRRL